MLKAKLTYLFDEMDCETCGTSYAEGFRIEVDGELIVELIPHAHCYDGEDYAIGRLIKETIMSLKGISEIDFTESWEGADDDSR